MQILLFDMLVLQCILITLRCVSGRLTQLKFSKDYSVMEGPHNKGSPLHVNISINLRNIFEVNEKLSLITVETSIRMIWQDPRIYPTNNGSDWDFDFITFNGKIVKRKFWIPDVFIDGAKNARIPKYHLQPMSLRYYKNRNLRLSLRINFDVICQMDFHKYPNDEQLCDIPLESWDTSMDDMKLNWDLSNSVINPNITLDQFSPLIYFKKYDTQSDMTSYSGLIIRIQLQRLIPYHVIQTFIPSIVFVILGWISLFLDPQAIPGRVKMVMLSLLTSLAMFNSVRDSTPQVSYVSYLDIWMVMCLIFIFSILIEFSLVLWFIRIGKKPLAQKIEIIWIIVFPIIFGIFVIIYWCLLLKNNSSKPTVTNSILL